MSISESQDKLLEDTESMANYLQYLKVCGGQLALEDDMEAYSALLRLVCAARVELVDTDLSHQ